MKYSRSVLVLLPILSIFASCSHDRSFQEPVTHQIRKIESSINEMDKRKFYQSISSTGDDVLSLYKVFSLYVSSFKRNRSEKVLEFSIFKIEKSFFGGNVIATVLLLNNRIDHPAKKKYKQEDEIVSRLLDLGLPDKLELYFTEVAPGEYKLSAVGYPFLYKWITLYGALQ